VLASAAEPLLAEQPAQPERRDRAGSAHSHRSESVWGLPSPWCCSLSSGET